MFAYCNNSTVSYSDSSGSRRVAVTVIDAGYLSASVTNANSLPPKGDPNSSEILLNPDGTPKQKRWYGPDGNAERDRDYNHAGDLEFPHDHTWNNGKRGKDHLPPSPDYKFSVEPFWGISIMITCTVGFVYVVANDLVGIGVADNFLLGPLVEGILEGVTKYFR